MLSMAELGIYHAWLAHSPLYCRWGQSISLGDVLSTKFQCQDQKMPSCRAQPGLHQKCS